MTNGTGSFSDEQIEFAALAAKTFASFGTAAATSADHDLAGIRANLAEIGLPLLAVPEELGGVGMTEPDVVLILEEAGYADVPVPVAETVAVVAPMVARYGSAEQRERWLPALARGDSLGTTVCPGGGLGSRRGADLALVEYEDRVHVVDLGACEAEGVLVPGCEAGPTPAGSVLGGPAALAELHARGAWVTSAVLCGVARRLLDLSVEYSRTREQFGLPIGSFQAVKHMLADVAVGIESARPASWETARLIAADDPRGNLAASVSKAVASRAEGVANDHALQIHGGVGFTQEHPLHRWLLYGHELESRWGSAAAHHAAVGRFAVRCDSLIETFLP